MMMASASGQECPAHLAPMLIFLITSVTMVHCLESLDDHELEPINEIERRMIANQIMLLLVHLDITK